MVRMPAPGAAFAFPVKLLWGGGREGGREGVRE